MAQDQLITIEPKKSLNFIDLKELWKYRELLTAFVRRDITTKYRQTVIGGSWAIIQPLTTMIIFSFFFGKLAKIPSEGVPYPIFSYAGLLLWTYFSTALLNASNSMVTSSSLITKVYFPRIIVPLATTLQGLVDYAVAGVILIGMMSFYHVPVTIGLLGLPIIAILTWLLSVGVGLILASLNVTYRDVRFVVPFIIQLWLYATPVIYPASVAERFRLILTLNPMTGYVEAHRALVLGQPLAWDSLALSFTFTVIFLLIGMFYFKKTEKGFADVI